MNPLTHVHVAKRLIDAHKLQVDEDQCLLGSVLPDLTCLHLIDYRGSHDDSLGFIHYLLEKDPGLVSLGFGMMLHSETPGGVDKYTHGPGGFIEQHEMAMFDIVKRYKHKMQGGELKNFMHTFIEFACDSFQTAREADLLKRAFQTVDLERVAYHLAIYFKGDGKKILRALSYLKKFDWEELTHVKGVAKTWDKFQFYQNLAESKGIGMMKHITGAWSLLRHNNTEHMLDEARHYLKDIYPAYLMFLHQKLSEHLVPHFPKPVPNTVRQRV